MSKSYLKEAEKNVINQAKAWSDAMEFVDALSNFGNKACHDYIAKGKFFEGLKTLRDAMYAEQSEAIRNCFCFVGVGGKDAEQYSRDRFKETFGGNYSIMHFLDKWGHCPSAYKSEQADEFLKECKEKKEEYEI